MIRALILVGLSFVAWAGSQLSRFGAVGQDMREWALEQLQELK